MQEIRLLSSKGVSLRSLEDWLNHAGPKMGIRHWKDGRSAKELAKAFLRDGSPMVPSEIQSFITQLPMPDLRLHTGLAEHVTALDSFSGEGRNHDMVLLGQCGNSRQVLIGLEAKADEPFDDTIATRLEKNRDKIESGMSNVGKRIENLGKALFGSSFSSEDSHLRYQLMTGAAGTLAEARLRGADVAVFLVYEMTSSACKPANLARNATDFATFIQRFGAPIDGEGAALYGPFHVPGNDTIDGSIPLYIGKVSVCLQ